MTPLLRLSAHAMHIAAPHRLPASNAPARRLLAAGLCVFAAAFVALVVLFYTFPVRYDSWFYGQDPQGMQQFQAHLGLGWMPHSYYRYYSRAFRMLLVLLWAGYALITLACLRGARLAGRFMAVILGLAGLIIALFSPPLLSTDAYAYASHGRIFVLYAHNPYLWMPAGLVPIHDPTARFLVWNWPTIYGPVWTWLEIGIAALLRPFGIWPEIVAFKLIGAAALLTAALAGRRIAARFSPGRENLTFLAIGLNPLFLLEGPGSGHNDLVLISFLLLGAMFYFDKKYVAAALCLGLSVGIKPITLALLPWVLLDYSRGRSWKKALTGIAAGTALVVLPLLALFAPFWAGPATIAAMQQRTYFEQTPAEIARILQIHDWLLGHHLAPRIASTITLLYQDWPLILLYAALSVWVWKSQKTGAWLTAWAIFSVALMFLFLKPAFPWYIVWFWPICLLRWDRWHLTLSALCLVLSLVWVWGYALLSLRGDPTEHHWIRMGSLPALNDAVRVQFIKFNVNQIFPEIMRPYGDIVAFHGLGDDEILRDLG